MASKLLKNTFLLFSMQISGYLFPLISFPYLSRVLGAEYYGVVVFVNAFMVYFQILLDFGFILYGTELCAKARDESSELSKITMGIIQAKLFLSLLGLVVLLLVLFVNDSLSKEVLFVLLSYLPVVFTSLIPDFLFRGIERMGAITYRTIVTSTIYTILIFVFIDKADDYIFIPVINVITAVITGIWSWLYIYRRVQFKLFFVGGRYVKGLLKGAFGFFTSRLAVSAFSSSNVFFLGLIGTPNAALGHFGFSNNLISMAKSIFTPLVDSIYPYMIKEKNFALIRKILLVSIPVLLTGIGLLYYLSDFIVLTLGGDGFYGAVPYFNQMLPLIFIALPTYLLGFPTLGAMGLANRANLSVIIGSGFHFVSLFLLFSIGMFTIEILIGLTTLTELIILFVRCYFIFINKDLFLKKYV